MPKLKTKNYKLKTNYIIGIDEVGRGALAGPVVVAAVAVTTKFRIKNAEFRIKKKSRNSEFFFCQRQIPGGSILNSKLAKLRDSKKLTPKQRELWFEYIKNELALPHAVAMVSPTVIDKINISQAANLAATRALSKLTKNLKLKTKRYSVFLDGGLYIKKLKTKNLKLKTIIRGDEKIPAIMLASIVAKVRRDKMMVKLHKKYPKYAFDRHKGYGTKKHIKAIRKFGPSPIHRRTFKIKI